MQIIEVKNQIVSTIALIDDEDKILIGKRPVGKTFENLWEFPGGKVKKNETVEQALIRETKEETNLDVSIERLGLIDFKSDGGFKGDALHFIFIGHIKEDSEEIKIQEGEIEEFRFVEPSELSALLHKQVGDRVNAIFLSKNEETVYTEYGKTII